MARHLKPEQWNNAEAKEGGRGAGQRRAAWLQGGMQQVTHSNTAVQSQLPSPAFKNK